MKRFVVEYGECKTAQEHWTKRFDNGDSIYKTETLMYNKTSFMARVRRFETVLMKNGIRLVVPDWPNSLEGASYELLDVARKHVRSKATTKANTSFVLITENDIQTAALDKGQVFFSAYYAKCSDALHIVNAMFSAFREKLLGRFELVESTDKSTLTMAPIQMDPLKLKSQSKKKPARGRR